MQHPSVVNERLTGNSLLLCVSAPLRESFPNNFMQRRGDEVESISMESVMDFKNLPAQYDHEAAQKRWYPFWEQRRYFHAEADDPRPAFVIVIPPPNVTG